MSVLHDSLVHINQIEARALLRAIARAEPEDQAVLDYVKAKAALISTGTRIKDADGEKYIGGR